MAVRQVDRVLVAQAVLVLVLVASIVVQGRVDGFAQTAMLILGGSASLGLVVTLALRRTSPFPSQNARRDAPGGYNRGDETRPQAAAPAPTRTTGRRKSRNNDRR